MNKENHNSAWKLSVVGILTECLRALTTFLYLSFASTANLRTGVMQPINKCGSKLSRGASSDRQKSSHGEVSKSRVSQGDWCRMNDGTTHAGRPRSKRWYLRDVHHCITAERSGRGQVIEAQKSRDDTILINSANHGAIHKEDYTVLIHRNACK